MDTHSSTFRRSRSFVFSSIWFLFMAQGAMNPHLSRYFDLDLRLSDSQMALLWAIPYSFAILSQPLWGYLADRLLGRTQTYRLCLFFTAAMLGVFPFIYKLGGFPFLMVNTIFLTIGYISCSGLANSIMLSFLGPEERKNFGKIRCIGSVSFMTSAFLLGAPLIYFSIKCNFMPHTLLFLTSFSFFFIAASLSQWNVKDFQPHTPPENFSLQFLKDPNLIAFYIAVLCVGAASSANNMYLGPYIGHLGYSETFFAYIWLFAITSESILGFNLNILIRYIGLKNALLMGFGAEGIRWFLMIFIHSKIGILLIYLLHGPAIVGYIYSTAMYLDSQCDERIRSTAQTFYVFFFYLGQVLAFFIGGALVGHDDSGMRAEAIRSSFWFYSACGTFAAVFGYFFIRKEKSV